MAPPCFAASLAPAHTSFTSRPATTPMTAPSARALPSSTPRAELKLTPGIPAGQDPLDNAPMRYYVPRPSENYDDRGFATLLPRTWEGEVNTIGQPDIEPVTKEDIENAKMVKVSSQSTSAFLEYSAMIKDERKQMLVDQAARNAVEKKGRPTCGEEEGCGLVSNYNPILVDGVKCVEYWGVANGPVPRRFGEPLEF